jgi:hypothetical protein
MAWHSGHFRLSTPTRISPTVLFEFSWFYRLELSSLSRLVARLRACAYSRIASPRRSDGVYILDNIRCQLCCLCYRGLHWTLFHATTGRTREFRTHLCLFHRSRLTSGYLLLARSANLEIPAPSLSYRWLSWSHQIHRLLKSIVTLFSCYDCNVLLPRFEVNCVMLMSEKGCY